MARELEGKVAVVTGAASGIGLASTEAMLVPPETLMASAMLALTVAMVVVPPETETVSSPSAPHPKCRAMQVIASRRSATRRNFTAADPRAGCWTLRRLAG